MLRVIFIWTGEPSLLLYIFRLDVCTHIRMGKMSYQPVRNVIVIMLIMYIIYCVRSYIYEPSLYCFSLALVMWIRKRRGLFVYTLYILVILKLRSHGAAYTYINDVQKVEDNAAWIVDSIHRIYASRVFCVLALLAFSKSIIRSTLGWCFNSAARREKRADTDRDKLFEKLNLLSR